jgi:signal transduction histidine kinase
VSLRLSLTLTYTILLTLTLASFGLVLYFMMRQNVEQEMDRRLRIRAQQVSATIWPQSDSLTAGDLTAASLDLSPLADLAAQTLYVQVLDRSGEVLATSDNLEGLSLPVQDAELQKAISDGPTMDNLQLGGAGKVRMLSSPIRAADGQIVGVLQVGQSRTAADDTMEALRLRLLMLGLGAVVVAGASGWLVADRGLRPLSLMAGKAKDFADRRNFAGRLQITRRHDEVGKLASTIDRLLETVEGTLGLHRQFLADTSHELRNPLLAIRTNLELLGRMPLGESRDECVREATHQVERMSRLVADLLLLARAESGQIIERRAVPLRPLLERAVGEARKRAAGQTVELCIENDVSVLGDGERLHQIFTNLLDNALRYTPPPGRIELSLRRENGWARVDVDDTGTGIATEHLPKVFDRFYQVDQRNGAGSGLGLAIVKHLSEAHGGTAVVQSQPGAGSCFTVRLPILGSERNAAASESLVEPPRT